MSSVPSPVTAAGIRLSPRYLWKLRTTDTPHTGQELLELLFASRGIGASERESFLAPSFEHALHDPALVPQCTVAVERLLHAIDQGRPIAIFGDYDVDGVTATVLLSDVLMQLGGIVQSDLPHREEGYGLTVSAAQRLVPPAHILVTVDNGVSAGSAVAAAIDRGAEVIIIDHHAVNGALPPGALVVHPGLPSSRYPFPHLSAVAVAWKVAVQLLAARGRSGEERFLLDLVTLGTLADSMPLVGENRALVYWGLEVLRRSRRPGLQLLAEQAGVPLSSITAEDVTYKLIPRLNAAGRLRHANLALELLRATDMSAARRLVLELDAVNEERRVLTEEVLTEARRQLPRVPDIVFVAGAWPLGLLGVVASRLAEEFGRPAVAVAVRDGECVASIRGDGVNVMSLVQETEALLTKFGGHPGAAGFSFPRSALDGVANFFSSHPPVVASSEPILQIDCPLPLDLVSFESARMLTQLEPFGHGNERPVFLLSDVTVAESRAVGASGDHTRFVFRGTRHDDVRAGIAFRWGARRRPSLGSAVDVAAEMRLDTFRGVPRVDLHIHDLRSPVAVHAALPVS